MYAFERRAYSTDSNRPAGSLSDKQNIHDINKIVRLSISYLWFCGLGNDFNVNYY